VIDLFRFFGGKLSEVFAYRGGFDQWAAKTLAVLDSAMDRAIQFSRKKAAGSSSKRLSFPRKRESMLVRIVDGFPLSRE